MRRTPGTSIAGFVGTFQDVSIAIDDLEVRQTPIVEQVRPGCIPILIPDAEERYSMIHFGIFPEAAARFAAATRLKSPQQWRLFAWRTPELPRNNAGAMPRRPLVGPFVPQIDVPAELIDGLAADAAEARAACMSFFSIWRRRRTKGHGQSAVRPSQSPCPSLWHAASRRQSARKTISPKRMTP